MMGKRLLLRLQKCNAHDRNHRCMNEDEKKDGQVVMIGWEQVISPDWALVGIIACYLGAR